MTSAIDSAEGWKYFRAFPGFSCRDFAISIGRLTPCSLRWVKPECRYSCRPQPCPAPRRRPCGRPGGRGPVRTTAARVRCPPGQQPGGAGVPDTVSSTNSSRCALRRLVRGRATYGFTRAWRPAKSSLSASFRSDVPRPRGPVAAVPLPPIGFVAMQSDGIPTSQRWRGAGGYRRDCSDSRRRPMVLPKERRCPQLR